MLKFTCVLYLCPFVFWYMLQCYKKWLDVLGKCIMFKNFDKVFVFCLPVVTFWWCLCILNICRSLWLTVIIDASLLLTFEGCRYKMLQCGYKTRNGVLDWEPHSIGMSHRPTEWKISTIHHFSFYNTMQYFITTTFKC